MHVAKSKNSNRVVLHPRKTSRKYLYDYYAFIEDTHGNYDLFGRGGAVSSIEKNIAKQKAVFEALERYCGSHVHQKLRKYSFNSFEKGGAMNPRKLTYFTDSQYVSQNRFKKVGTSQEISWVRGQSYNTRLKIWVPAFAVFLGYNRFAPTDEIFIPTTSSGLALGTSVDDALKRGIFELIERDSIMITWLTKRPSYRLDLNTITSVDLINLKNHAIKEGLRVEVCILTVNNSPITVLAIVYKEESSTPYASFGFATGTDIEFTALKAMEEALMVRSTLELKHVRKLRRPRSKEIRTFLDHVVLYSFPETKENWRFLLRGKTRSLNELKSEFESAEIGMRNILKELKRKFDIAYVDLTTSEVKEMGYSVVRVIIPGLQPLFEDSSMPIVNSKRLRSFLKQKVKVNTNPHPFG